MNVLAPNTLGFTGNVGIEGLKSNVGFGVSEAKTRLSGVPNVPHIDRMRRASARQYGVPIQQVGF
jgi:hypothetical protein